MATQVVDLGFRPRPWQYKVLASLKRFSVLIVHRRAGKTVAAVAKLVDSALRCQQIRGRYAYIAPELKQAKRVAWDYLKSFASRIPGHRINESEVWVEFPNGARVGLYGADDPDSLRGVYLDGAVLDEVAQMKAFVWGEILVPQLADRQGWALFIGTPKGINLLSELYFKAVVDPVWYAELMTFDATQALDAATLEQMRAEMTDQQWRQEMLCDFNASTEDSLISIDLVRGALGKHIPVQDYNFASRIIGVDVADTGPDRTVIQPRQGLAAFVPKVLHGAQTMEVADAVMEMWESFSANSVQIDASGGYGAGVVSRLMQLNYSPSPIQFGGKARDDRYENKSAEMWWDMKLWFEQGGALPQMQEYVVDISGRRFDYKNARGRLALERKDQMRARGLSSPDLGDALACTFAYNVPAPNEMLQGLRADLLNRVDRFFDKGKSKVDYDPLERA